tara:strand:- start:6388 stop:7590 length:1203 start_codon:yes stop_codon:yes gene_type:complete
MALTQIKSAGIADNAITDAKVADAITVAASGLSGNTLASGVTASSLTSVGTLSSLIVSGTVRVGDAFTLPSSIGSAGQILQVPSSGTTLEWATAGGGADHPLQLESTDAGADGARIELYHNSSSPAAGDQAGVIKAFHEGTSGTKRDTGRAFFEVTDPQDDFEMMPGMGAQDNTRTAFVIHLNQSGSVSEQHRFTEIGTYENKGMQITGSDSALKLKASSNNGTIGMQFRNSSNSQRGAINYRTDSNNRMQILVNGSANALWLHGADRKAEFFGELAPFDNNSYNIGSTSKRWSVIYTSNSVNVSDKTTKKYITDCSLGVDFINTLKPKSYKMKGLNEGHDDYNRKHFGLIAQDLIDTELNDSVFGDKDGEYSLAYNDLIAPMIKSIQELSAKVTALEGS